MNTTVSTGSFCTVLCVVTAALVITQAEAAESPTLQKWQRSRGWGWVWGPSDEVGTLNEMTDLSRLAALRLATQGKVYDLGVTYDRTSYKWPGHSPGAGVWTFFDFVRQNHAVVRFAISRREI